MKLNAFLATILTTFYKVVSELGELGEYLGEKGSILGELGFRLNSPNSPKSKTFSPSRLG